MGFGDAILAGFQKFATFSGRAGQAEYWYWVLFSMLAIIGWTVVDLIVVGVSTGPFSTAVTLALILPGLAALARRLHDSDHSGWWMLLLLVPLIGLIIVLLMASAPGTSGTNRYGPEPA